MLWLLLLAGPMVWLGWRGMAGVDRVRRWTAIGLRVAVLVVLVMMLAGLQAVQRHTDLTVVAVVDQSESVRRFARPPVAEEQAHAQPAAANGGAFSIEQWVRDWLRRSAADRRNDDRLGVVTFDGRPTVRTMPTMAVDLDPGTIDHPVEGTDIAAAIRAALALFPPDSGARLLLITDGNDTASDDVADVLAAAREAAANGIPVDVLALPYRLEREVIVEGLYSPTEARRGQTVPLRVVLRATTPTRGRLQLFHDGELVQGVRAPIGEQDWTQESGGETRADRFVAVKQIDLPLVYAGVNRFEAVFEAAGEMDEMTANNRVEAFTLVAGQGKLLFVDGVGGASGSILPRALELHGIELDVVPSTAVPARLSELQRYDAVVFQNVPAEVVTAPQQRMLSRYVNDLGGGFVMIGGDQSFGAGGWTNTPIDRILPVTCEIPSQTVLPSGALVLVIDRSGSMASPVTGSRHSQQELANEAAVLALQTLYPQDLVSVVVFDHDAQVIVALGPNAAPDSVASKVRSVQPSGGTNVYAGLEAAYEQLANVTVQDAAVKHVILLTDGQSTPPPGSGGYIPLVGRMTRAGITISAIGVGDGHDGQLLQQLAQMSGGQYHPIVNPNDLPQVFIKEARTIRKNLIKEQPFQPQHVQTGSPIMANMSAVPPLEGLVLTGEKHDPRVFMPLIGADGEPVFAHWQVGLGRSAAFTSDATNRWATAWLNWGGYSDFWGRTMRAVARPARSRDIDLLTALRGDQLRLRLDAVGAEEDERRGGRAAFARFKAVRGSVIKPDGTTENVTLEQTGPGVYEATLPATAEGNYIVSLFAETADGERRAVFGGASRPPGEELRRFESNLSLLRQVAQVSGGRWLDAAAPEPAGLFARTREFESRSIRPVWRTLLTWLIVLFLLDVACRRIAWDAPAAWRWLKAHAAIWFGSLRPREATAGATLDALKSRRTEAREKLMTPEPEAEVASRKRKFEAAAGTRAEKDFTAAVGGAKAEGGAAKPKVEEPEQPAAEDTTSRLREAKRRTRERLGE